MFRERRGGEEKNTTVRETLIGCLRYVAQMETGPTTEACALTGHWTHNLFGALDMLQLTELPGQGQTIFSVLWDF